MLENFPVSEIIRTVFYGSGDCAEILWTFLGMSMPQWTFVWYVGLGLVTLWAVYRRAVNKTAA
jgi:disulfide bond formation protein DsbB